MTHIISITALGISIIGLLLAIYNLVRVSHNG